MMQDLHLALKHEWFVAFKEGDNHDFRSPNQVEQLAKKIIDYNFRFLADFVRKEWD